MSPREFVRSNIGGHQHALQVKGVVVSVRGQGLRLIKDIPEKKPSLERGDKSLNKGVYRHIQTWHGCCYHVISENWRSLIER